MLILDHPIIIRSLTQVTTNVYFIRNTQITVKVKVSQYKHESPLRLQNFEAPRISRPYAHEGGEVVSSVQPSEQLMLFTSL